MVEFPWASANKSFQFKLFGFGFSQPTLRLPGIGLVLSPVEPKLSTAPLMAAIDASLQTNRVRSFPGLLGSATLNACRLRITAPSG